MTEKYKIMIIENDSNTQQKIASDLMKAGYETSTAGTKNFLNAVALYTINKPNLILNGATMHDLPRFVFELFEKDNVPQSHYGRDYAGQPLVITELARGNEIPEEYHEMTFDRIPSFLDRLIDRLINPLIPYFEERFCGGISR